MSELAVAGLDSRAAPGRHLWPGVDSLLSRCANPRCSTGWMRLWRSREVPVFEGKWACSPECMEEVVRQAVRREAGEGIQAGFGEGYAHRIPLGLLLVRQGRISVEQLRRALRLRSRAVAELDEPVRLGEWLVESGVLSEPALMRAIGMQWNCPVLSLAGWRPGEVASVMPRLFSELANALPVRVAGGQVLHVAFRDGIDHTLSYALRRILGLQVSEGVAGDSEFRAAHTRYFELPGPGTRYLEVAGDAMLIRAVARLIEREKPVDARLVRFRNYYWLRLWKRHVGRTRHAARDRNPECAGMEDVLCAVPAAGTLPPWQQQS